MVYLDHAATTPMHPAAVEAMTAVFGTVGNASSLHTSGRAARRRLEESREQLAAAWFGARPSRGDLHRRRHRGRQPRRQGHLSRAGRAATPTAAVNRNRWWSSTTRVLDAVEWRAGHEGAEGELAAGRRLPVRSSARRPGGPPRPRTPSRGRPAGSGDVGQQRGAPATSCSPSPSWPRSPTSSACRCIPTPCRRWGRCRSTSPRPGSTR